MDAGTVSVPAVHRHRAVLLLLFVRTRRVLVLASYYNLFMSLADSGRGLDRFLRGERGHGPPDVVLPVRGRTFTDPSRRIGAMWIVASIALAPATVGACWTSTCALGSPGTTSSTGPLLNFSNSPGAALPSPSSSPLSLSRGTQLMAADNALHNLDFQRMSIMLGAEAEQTCSKC